VGLQLLGAPFNEATILKLAHHFQQATDWHKMRPNLWLRNNDFGHEPKAIGLWPKGRLAFGGDD